MTALAFAVTQYPYLPAVAVAAAGVLSAMVWLGPWGWDR